MSIPGCPCCGGECEIFANTFDTEGAFTTNFTYSGTYSYSSGVVSSTDTNFLATCDTTNTTPYDCRVHANLRGSAGQKPTLHAAIGTDKIVAEFVPGTNSGYVNFYINSVLWWVASYDALVVNTWLDCDLCVKEITSYGGLPVDWVNVTVTIGGSDNGAGALTGGEQHGIHLHESLDGGASAAFGGTGDFTEFSFNRLCLLCNVDAVCWFAPTPNFSDSDYYESDWQSPSSGTWSYSAGEMITTSGPSIILSRGEDPFQDDADQPLQKGVTCHFKFGAVGQKIRVIIAASDTSNYLCAELELGTDCSMLRILDVTAGVDNATLVDDVTSNEYVTKIKDLATATEYAIIVELRGTDELFAQLYNVSGGSLGALPLAQMSCDAGDVAAYGGYVGLGSMVSGSTLTITVFSGCGGEPDHCQLIYDPFTDDICNWDTVFRNVAYDASGLKLGTGSPVGYDSNVAKLVCAIPERNRYSHMAEAVFSVEWSASIFPVCQLLIAGDEQLDNAIYVEAGVQNVGGNMRVTNVSIGKITGGNFEPYNGPDFSELISGVSAIDSPFRMRAAIDEDGVVYVWLANMVPSSPADTHDYSNSYDYGSQQGYGNYVGILCTDDGKPWFVNAFRLWRCGNINTDLTVVACNCEDRTEL